VRTASKENKAFTDRLELIKKYDAPSWLHMDADKLEGTMISAPTDLNPPFEINFWSIHSLINKHFIITWNLPHVSSSVSIKTISEDAKDGCSRSRIVRGIWFDDRHGTSPGALVFFAGRCGDRNKK